jgi:hypothetical protein
MYLMVVHRIVWFEKKNMFELPILPTYLQYAWKYVLVSYSSIENAMNYQTKLPVDVPTMKMILCGLLGGFRGHTIQVLLVLSMLRS